MQITLNTATKDQIKNAWAFAKTLDQDQKNFLDYRNCVITSCSLQAKILGIRIGMSCQEARLLIPRLKILVIGANQHARKH